MKIPNEGHIFPKPENKLAFYQACKNSWPRIWLNFASGAGGKAEIHATANRLCQDGNSS